MSEIKRIWQASDPDPSGRRALRNRLVRRWRGLLIVLAGLAWAVIIVLIPLLWLTILILGVYWLWTHI